MTPEDFLDQVVTTNVVKLGENRGSLRHAVNAILSLDAFAGILFADVQLKGRAPCREDIPPPRKRRGRKDRGSGMKVLWYGGC